MALKDKIKKYREAQESQAAQQNPVTEQPTSTYAQKVKETLLRPLQPLSQVATKTPGTSPGTSLSPEDEKTFQRAQIAFSPIAKSHDDAVKAAQQEAGYRRKYSGMNQTQMREAIGGLTPDTAEYKWLDNYITETMRPEDYDRELETVRRDLQAAQAELHQLVSVGGADYFTSEEIARANYLQKNIEQLTQKSRELEKQRKYRFLAENPDFAEQSKPTATTRKSNYFDIVFQNGNYQYDMINGLLAHNFQAEAKEKGNSTGAAVLGAVEGNYAYMLPEEKAIYNYLYNTQGADSAGEYIDYIENTLSERAQKYALEEWVVMAKEMPVSTSIASVPLSLWGGVGYLSAVGQKAVNDISGDYTAPINYNSAAMMPAKMSSTIRGTVAQDLVDQYGVIALDEEKHPILSKLLNGKSWGDVYQLGMSMVDSTAVALMSPMLGTNGTLLLAGNAATQTMLGAVANGASDEQALTMGALSGAFEYLFEKYELESLLGESGGFLRKMFTQALSEGFGEGMTSIANLAADSVVMADKSELNRLTAEYMKNNPELSEAEARKKALADLAIQVAWDAVGGLITGGIMGGGSYIAEKASTHTQQPQSAPQSDVTAQVESGQPAQETPAEPVPKAQTEEMQGLKPDSESDVRSPMSEPLPPDQAQSMNIFVYLITNAAEKRDISLREFHIATSEVNVFAPTKADAKLAADLLQPIVDQLGIEIYQGYLEAMRAYAKVEPALDPLAFVEDVSALGRGTDTAQPQSPPQTAANTQAENGQPAQETAAEPTPGSLEWVRELSDLGAEAGAAQKTENGTKDRISMEEFASQENPVWRNVEYSDDTKKAEIMQETHDAMVAEGAVVKVTDEVASSVEAAYPDLRSMKKAERAPILKSAIAKLKNDLRQFLNGFKNQSFEFEVNGKVLDATLYGTGINEVLEKVTKQKANMLYSTEDIFRNARYLYSTPDYDGDPNVYRWNYFYTPIQIGNEIVGVRIAVRDMVKGTDGSTSESQIYNWGIKKDASLDGGSHSQKAASSDVSSDASTNSIPQTVPGVNTNSAQPPAPTDSMGAAPSGFDPNSHLQYQYGTLPEGKKAVRPDDLPVSTDGTNRVSQTAVTVKGAKVTPDDFADLLTKDVTERNGMTYIPITNNATVQKAIDFISEEGWLDAKAKWQADVRYGKAGADMSAMGALLLNNAAKAGDKVAWLEILHDYQLLGTNTAQGMQALQILKKLSPSDKLYMAKRSIKKMVEDMKLDTDITIDPELEAEYNAAETDEQRDAALKKIQKDIARQLPTTFMEKFTALRYLNMLGNLRTQARNVVGNLTMMGTRAIHNAVTTGIERIANWASHGKVGRTRSVIVSKDQMALGMKDFDDLQEYILDGGKFNDNNPATGFARGVMEQKQIFGFKPLEGYRKVTNWMMEQGDIIFAKQAYARALAGYLKANGVTEADFSKVDPAIMDDARLFAAKEAQEATFRDSNWLSNWVSKIGRRKDTPAGVKILAEGVMPFRKTPANVFVRAWEYSPLGIINSVVLSVQAAKKDSDVTANQVINSWAKTLTGTGLFGMGMLLQCLGLLSAGPDEDEQKDNFEDLNGWQDYALTLPDGTNLTIDCFSPSAIPVLMGAQLMKQIGENGFQLKDLEKALTFIADPLVEMSMLQGVNDSLENIQYADSNLGQFAINAGLSYLTQGLTNTLAGQLERSFEDSRMQTYVDKDSDLPAWLQRAMGKASAKTPGLDYSQIPYINAWGEEEQNPPTGLNLIYNLLSPSYIDKGKEDDLTRELNRLNDAQSDVNVYPSVPDKTLTVNGQNYNLPAEEYVQLAKLQGQTQRQIVEDLIASSDYANLSDEDKAKAIRYAYDYARDSARGEVVKDHPGITTTWMKEIGDNVAEGIIRHITADGKYTYLSVSDASYVDNLLTGLTAEKGRSGVRPIQQIEAIAGSDLPEKDQKAVLQDTLDPGAYEKYLRILATGMDTDDYALSYRLYLDAEGGTGKKERIISSFQTELNVSRSVAEKLYDIYSGKK